MRLDIDLTAKTVYVTVCGGGVARTVELSDRVLVDLADDGSVSGFEVLDLGPDLDGLPVDAVLARYELPERVVQQLRAVQAACRPMSLEVA